jgi:molecular chaperone DnaK
VPQIEVTFDIDANGILKVTAKDKATGKEQSVRIEASTGLTKEEIEKMKREAEQHLAEDKRKRELVETKNQAENTIYLAEKTLREAGEKITPEDRKEVEDKINDLKQVLGGDDLENIKKRLDDLSLAISKIGAKMYQGGQQTNNPNNPDNSSSDDNKPEDAEFKD